ncbi:MAG: Rrf2 family transcriptional regulator [Planctomycetaceae bacterium]|jgi:Rrf2 family protein|nr:Rrf2 family transcriptional regulator [Planctomycetaceae bacterium]
MKISTKGRYALRMMVDLAQHRHEGYIALKDIAKRQGISKKYLEQIVPLLNRSDYLQTNRGFQGGYMLTKPPDRYTVGDILRVTEGSISPIAGLEYEPIHNDRSSVKMILHVWRGLEKVIVEYLDSITLQDILDRYSEEGQYDYYI